MIKKATTAGLVLVLAVVIALGGLAPGEAEARVFGDVNGHWAEWHIDAMVDQGIFNGYPDGTFRPDNDITRAEFVKIVVEAFDLTGTASIPFADADAVAESWAGDYVARAVTHGVVKADEYQGGFGMDTPITRGEIARMVVRAVDTLEQPFNPHGQVKLADVPSGALGEYVRQAVEYRVINGYPDGTFRSDNTATRAEAATMMERALKLQHPPHEGGGAIGDMKLAFLDVYNKAWNSEHTTPEIAQALLDDIKENVWSPEGSELVSEVTDHDSLNSFTNGKEGSLRWLRATVYKLDGTEYANTALYDMQMEKVDGKWMVVGFKHAVPPVRGHDPADGVLYDKMFDPAYDD